MTNSKQIESTFKLLKAANQKAVIPFLTADFPNRDVFLELLHALPKHGADIIEIGIPFSDPMADGSTIQKTSAIAIQNGFTIAQCLDDIRTFKSIFPTVPIVIMTYANPIVCYGATHFAEQAAHVGVDGLLLVDVPPELTPTIFNTPPTMDMIHLITATTAEDRLSTIQQHASGFSYYVSVKGTTGNKTPSATEISSHVTSIKKSIQLPMVIGFGISSPAIAKEMADISDGIVIGSSLLAPFLNSDAPHSTTITTQCQMIQEFKTAIHS